MVDEKTPPPKKGWDELVFGAFEKIASAPQKLKDPSAAFEWVKGIREDIQARIVQEVSEKLSQIDFQSTANKVGEHLADKYEIEIKAKISLKPKKSGSSKKEESSNENSEQT